MSFRDETLAHYGIEKTSARTSRTFDKLLKQMYGIGPNDGPGDSLDPKILRSNNKREIEQALEEYGRKYDLDRLASAYFKGAGAPAIKGDPGAAPASGGGNSGDSGGQVIQGPWGDNAPKDEGGKSEDKPKPKKDKHKATTPEGAKKLFDAHKAKYPGTNKTEKDFLDDSAQTESGAGDAPAGGSDGGGGDANQNEQGGSDKAEKKAPEKKPYKPKSVDYKSDDVRGTPAQRRQEMEEETVAGLNKKYDKQRDENGDFPPKVQQKMDAEFSKKMDGFDKAEKRDRKQKVTDEKKKVTDARKEQDQADRDAYEQSRIDKYKAKGYDDVRASDAVAKDMKKYDDRKKKKDKRKDDGAIKTFLDSYKKFKGVTKTWLNPESNPIINEFKNAGMIPLANVDAGIKARVTDRHLSRSSHTRVASRFLAAASDKAVVMRGEMPFYRGGSGSLRRGPAYFISSEMMAKFYGPVSEYRIKLRNPKFVSQSEWGRFDTIMLRVDPSPIAELEAEGYDSAVWATDTPAGRMYTVFALDGLGVSKRARSASLGQSVDESSWTGLLGCFNMWTSVRRGRPWRRKV